MLPSCILYQQVLRCMIMVALSLQCLHLSLFHHDERLLLSSNTQQGYHYIMIKQKQQPPPLQYKARSLFCILHVLRGCQGFHRGIVSSLRTNNHNADQMSASITPHTGSSVATATSARVRETDTPPEPLYTVQAVCQAWNQSRLSVRVRSVGGRFIKQYRDMKKCT